VYGKLDVRAELIYAGLLSQAYSLRCKLKTVQNIDLKKGERKRNVDVVTVLWTYILTWK